MRGREFESLYWMQAFVSKNCGLKSPKIKQINQASHWSVLASPFCMPPIVFQSRNQFTHTKEMNQCVNFFPSPRKVKQTNQGDVLDRDSNLGPQDGRRRRIHCALSSSPTAFGDEKASLTVGYQHSTCPRIRFREI